MTSSASRVRRIIRRIVGRPVGSGRIPGRLPLVLERHQALFESVTVPPMPVPLLLVHTGGKPMAYLSSSRQQSQQSLPGLVTFLPRHVRSEVTLRGVGEGTVVYFDGERSLPAWLLRGGDREPMTFTNDVVVAITRRLMAELESRAPTESYLKSLATALLAELQRELARTRAVSTLPASRGGLRIAHTAIQYMLGNLGASLSVPDLAQRCGVGVTSFSSRFRQATGVTPHRYLRRARIERSCELLRTTSLTIGEVSESVGFRGQSHFCRAFVAERGLTPSAYRRACGASVLPNPPRRSGSVGNAR